LEHEQRTVAPEHSRRKRISLLCFVLWLLAGTVSAVILYQGGALKWRQTLGIAVFLSIGAFEFILARALRRFEPWSRKAGIVVSIIGLAAFPIGTAVCAASLYVLLKATWPAPERPNAKDQPFPSQT
jgi:hypothetical protein